jgi:hypothetical protein
MCPPDAFVTLDSVVLLTAPMMRPFNITACDTKNLNPVNQSCGFQYRCKIKIYKPQFPAAEQTVIISDLTGVGMVVFQAAPKNFNLAPLSTTEYRIVSVFSIVPTVVASDFGALTKTTRASRNPSLAVFLLTISAVSCP